MVPFSQFQEMFNVLVCTRFQCLGLTACVHVLTRLGWANSTVSRITRYWLKGSRCRKHQIGVVGHLVITELADFIRRNSLSMGALHVELASHCLNLPSVPRICFLSPLRFNTRAAPASGRNHDVGSLQWTRLQESNIPSQVICRVRFPKAF